MNEQQIEQLRRDFILTADREGWSDVDREEVGAQIAASIAAEDEAAIAAWAAELSWWRLMIESFAPRLRAFESRVKLEARERIAA